MGIKVKNTHQYEWVDVSVKNSTTTSAPDDSLSSMSEIFSNVLSPPPKKKITDVSPTINIKPGKWTINPDYVEPPKKKITPKKPKLNKGGCSICDDPDCPDNQGDIKIKLKKPKPAPKIKTYQVEQLNTKAREKERLIIDDGLFEIIRKI